MPRLPTLLVAALAAAAGCGGSSGDDTQAALQGDPANGAKVFDSAGRGSCHTLAAAGATGTAGPNLDELTLSEPSVATQVERGGSGMPAFAGRTSAQEIADVAAFVVKAERER
jgi:mono/diheme cytochrome c family protein